MKLSSYTTVYNCIDNKYPWKDSITSLLGFSDEVCIVDGGSTDGTWEELLNWSKNESRLKIDQHKIDWTRPDFAYESDGRQKTRARKLCTGSVCWQSDVDEIVVEKDYQKVRNLSVLLQESDLDLIALPIIEYWGSKGKVRIDINPWKWRISKNKDYIIHGIPNTLLRKREDGSEYALSGTDSCDYINVNSKEIIPFGFVFDIEKVNQIRLHALSGKKEYIDIYQNVIEEVIDKIPTVRHYSWYNIENKIHNYKKHWSKFWCSLYNKPLEDTIENNMMFDKAWKHVSDEDIKMLSEKLEEKLGGWIFHEKINWNKNIPWIQKNWE